MDKWIDGMIDRQIDLLIYRQMDRQKLTFSKGHFFLYLYSRNLAKCIMYIRFKFTYFLKDNKPCFEP